MEGGELRRERYRCVAGEKGQMASPPESACMSQQITVGDLHLGYKT